MLLINASGVNAVTAKLPPKLPPGAVEVEGMVAEPAAGGWIAYQRAAQKAFPSRDRGERSPFHRFSDPVLSR